MTLRMTDRHDPNLTLRDVRRMFHAVLAPWASDLLELRRRRLDVPGARGHAAWPRGTPIAAHPPGAQDRAHARRAA